MGISKSEQKKIENEMIFRRANEKVVSDLDALDAMHIKDGNEDLVRDKDLSLLFWCECSDEDCKERIGLKLDKYEKIHTNRRNFVVKPDHQDETIEKVVSKEEDYSVVKKTHSTPAPNNRLKHTDTDNS